MLRQLALTAAVALAITGVTAAPALASPPPPSGGDALAVYTGTVDAEGLAAIVDLGVDRHEIVVTSSDGVGQIGVEVILSGDQAEQLATEGTELAPKQQ